MALEAFRRIQIGKESTAGTPVAADKAVMGTLTMDPVMTQIRPRFDRNSLAEFFDGQSIDVSQICRMRYESELEFNSLVDFLGMCLKGGIAGVQQTSAAYLWTYAQTLTASQSQDSYTVEFGDNSQEFESDYVVAEDIELSFVMNEAMRIRANLFGRFPAKSTFTGSLNEPANFEIAPGTLLQVWIDSSWGNLVNTAITGLVSSATLRMPSGLVPVWLAGGGDLDFTKVIENRRHFEIELEMVLGSAAITEYDAYVAKTLRAVHLRVTGSTIESGHPYQLKVDMIGEYTSPPTLFGSVDGQDTVRMTLSSVEDSSGNEFRISVKNKTATT